MTSETNPSNKSTDDWLRENLNDELHALINQYRFGVLSYFEIIEHSLEIGNIQEAKSLLIEAEKAAQTVINELKTIHSITISDAEVGTFSDALKIIIAQVPNRFPLNNPNLKIILDCPDHLDLPQPLKHAMVRIASEAITNSIKHSGILIDTTIAIVVLVKQFSNQIILEVKDNGKGVDKIIEGYGIARMKQLIEKLQIHGFNAKLELESAPNIGTRITIISDLDNSEQITAS